MYEKGAMKMTFSDSLISMMSMLPVCVYDMVSDFT